MLAEISNVRQVPEEGFRRWFTDEDFDLIVWYADRRIDGFQLCYDKQDRERALTWRRKGGYSHNKVDDGEIPYGSKMAPILVADGVFEQATVAERFCRAAAEIDREVARFVHEKLSAYPGGQRRG